MKIKEKAKFSDEETKQKARELQQKLQEARIFKGNSFSSVIEERSVEKGKELSQAARELGRLKLKQQ